MRKIASYKRDCVSRRWYCCCFVRIYLSAKIVCPPSSCFGRISTTWPISNASARFYHCTVSPTWLCAAEPVFQCSFSAHRYLQLILIRVACDVSKQIDVKMSREDVLEHFQAFGDVVAIRCEKKNTELMYHGSYCTDARRCSLVAHAVLLGIFLAFDLQHTMPTTFL